MPTRTVIVVTVAAVLMTVAPISRAASQTSQADISSALIGEVRLLRAAIEHIVSAGASGQLILGRLQLQEQRVNAAVQRLQKTQGELTSLREQQADAEESLAFYGALLNGGPRRMPPHYSHNESLESAQETIALLKKNLGELAQSARRLAAEEAAYASELAGEQAVWADLNRRLDDAERMLARRQ